MYNFKYYIFSAGSYNSDIKVYKRYDIKHSLLKKKFGRRQYHTISYISVSRMGYQCRFRHTYTVYVNKRIIVVEKNKDKFPSNVFIIGDDYRYLDAINHK